MINKHFKLVAVCLIFVMLLSTASCGKKDENTSDEPVEAVSVMGDIRENTLKLSPNGSILEIACEDYSGTSVDVTGLEQYIKSEIDKYNSETGTNDVTFTEYKEENGFVRTAISYSNMDAYNDFNALDILVSLYNKDEVDEIAKEYTASQTDAAVAAPIDTADISEEELAAAGYDLEDLEELEEEQDIPGISTSTDAVATFTDASTKETVKSGDIDNSSYMMIVTSEKYNFVFNGGKVLYTNRFCEALNENTVSASGDGKSIIIYTYEF